MNTELNERLTLSSNKAIVEATMDRTWGCDVRLSNAHVVIKAVYNAVKHELGIVK